MKSKEILLKTTGKMEREKSKRKHSMKFLNFIFFLFKASEYVLGLFLNNAFPSEEIMSSLGRI